MTPELFEKYFLETLTPDEAALLKEKLDTDPAIRAAFGRYSMERAMIVGASGKCAAVREQAGLAIEADRGSGRGLSMGLPAGITGTWLRKVLALAATVVFIIGGWVAFNYTRSIATLACVGGEVYVLSGSKIQKAEHGQWLYSGEEIYAVSENSVAMIIWKDGSSLYLPHGGRMNLLQINRQKRINLTEGVLEAEFTKQPEGRPALVDGVGMTAEIVGTAIKMETRKDGTKLSVVSGEVRAKRQSDQKTVLVPSSYEVQSGATDFAPTRFIWANRFHGGARGGRNRDMKSSMVGNTCLQAGGESNAFVQAEVSWKNSWRASWLEGSTTYTNWDAAWIFVKYRVTSPVTGEWRHASLSMNAGDHVVPPGAAISVGQSVNTNGTTFGAGVFLYRSDEGSGNWTNTVKLRWNYAQDGVASTADVDVSVQAIEMVYVPQGSFYLGDGTTVNVQGQFCSSTNPAVPFLISKENCEITLGGSRAGGLGNNNAFKMKAVDDFNNTESRKLPAVFPKGYNAFYCMKYEISQGQWVDFFNMLADRQKGTGSTATGRDITSNDGKGSDAEVNRNTISWAGGTRMATCTTPDRACNFLSWDDLCAFADWAGLRPMTELEYEKACRGPLVPVENEYAWGTAAIMNKYASGTIDVTSPENGSEVWTNSASVGVGVEGRGAAVFRNTKIKVGGVAGGLGPVRGGLFATASSTRITSGATYWGIMEMSGNLWERTVTVGHGAGRAFTGEAGDGSLDATNGNANAVSWPSAAGFGFRGGNWADSPDYLRSSARPCACLANKGRHMYYGGRVVRQAPSVVE